MKARQVRPWPMGPYAEMTFITSNNVYLRIAQRLLLAFMLSLTLVLSGVRSLAAQPAGSGPGVDVRLVIDISGSMKRNDPNDLRQPAVDLLLRLLPPDSWAGVWTFGEQVNMLIPHRKVDDTWRALAEDKSTQISSAGLFTNIGDALEQAAAAPASDGIAKKIILLTDGMVDIAKDPNVNRQERQRIVDEVIRALQADGVTVHTVALSEQADNDLMEKLAVATDGIAAAAKSAEELMAIFLQAFDESVPTQQLPMTDNRFAVDSSVEEFTALIFRQNNAATTVIVTPDGTRYDAKSEDPDVRWHRSSAYDLITVKKPVEGEWQVVADIAPQSRVTVVSDLQLRVKNLPNNLFIGAGEELRFMLQEDGKAVADRQFLSLIDGRAELRYGLQEPSSEVIWSHVFDADSPPEDGIYQVELPLFDTVGAYQLSVSVDGKTFQRTFQQRMQVREPFTAELVEKMDEDGQLRSWIMVRSHSETIDRKQTQLAATVTSPLRRKWVVPLVHDDLGQWLGPARLTHPGIYTIRVRVTGQDTLQQEFQYDLAPLEIEHDPQAGFMTEPAAMSSSSISSASMVSAASSASSESVQSTADAESSLAADPDEVSERPAWVFYVLLVIGNLLLIAGGYYLYKRLVADDHHDEDEPEDQQMEPPALVPEEMMPPMEDSALAMDDGSAEEEEPPMEDLESQAMDDGVATSDDPQPRDEENLEENANEDKYVVDEDDLLSEMLRAQGFDLSEDDLDDAITSLIDELDGSAADGEDEAEPSDEFDDFDDDDK